MIIGVDASRYGHTQSTGVEWYSYHLLNNLLPFFGREHGNSVRLYAPRDFKTEVELPFNVHKRIIPFRRLWTVIRLSAEMLQKPVDVLFVPSHILPFFAPKKSFITIHDVAFRHLRKVYSRFQYLLLDRSTRRAVKKAWRILVPSEATKRDLVKFYRCPEEKISVIHHGAPEIAPLQSFPTAEIESLRQQFQLAKSDLFILYIGRLEAKKNLVRLVEAFQRFLIEFPDFKLILAGKRGVGFDAIWKTVTRLKLQAKVIMPGYITEREKAFLFTLCRFFAFPSLYEGFGLPVLEAFAFRRPVLTSNISSLPEVAGESAYLVNPEKVEEISVGLKRLTSDGILASKLIQRGQEQLKKFSWEKAAQQTHDLLVD